MAKLPKNGEQFKSDLKTCRIFPEFTRKLSALRQRSDSDHDFND
jgi:hypothetical protein